MRKIATTIDQLTPQQFYKQNMYIKLKQASFSLKLRIIFPFVFLYLQKMKLYIYNKEKLTIKHSKPLLKTFIKTT